MKTLILLLFAMTALAWSKDPEIDVEVKATHAVTHEDQSTRAVLDKGVMGAHAPAPTGRILQP